MFEPTTSFWDIAIVVLVVAGAGYYLYRKLFKKKGLCGGGCDCESCPSTKPEVKTEKAEKQEQ